MAKGVFSFHTMREACLAGDPLAWWRFVTLYGPLTRQLSAHYFPQMETEPILLRVFAAARADDGRVWRSFTGKGEKDFLFHWRYFLFAEARAARGPAPPTPLTPENFWPVLDTFPPLQRELLLLAYRRYRPEQLDEMTKFTADSARQIVGQARARVQEKVGDSLGAEPELGDHDALFAAIEQQQDEQCHPDRLFVRIADGQISWREREKVEAHIEGCLNCLYRSSLFREVFHYFHRLPPGDPREFAGLLSGLALPREAPRVQRPWWQRLLGG